MDSVTKKDASLDASVVRFAVLIRTTTDRVELLGQIHDTLDAAERMANFWQAHYRDTIQAEVVQFSVPTRGTAVPLAADVVVGGGKNSAQAALKGGEK